MRYLYLYMAIAALVVVDGSDAWDARTVVKAVLAALLVAKAKVSKGAE